MYEKKGAENMAEDEKNLIIRYGILTLEGLEEDLTDDEVKEMDQIRQTLALSHKEILEKAKDAIMNT